jgi:DNA-binding NarL/FixJ family response regulator
MNQMRALATDLVSKTSHAAPRLDMRAAEHTRLSAVNAALAGAAVQLLELLARQQRVLDGLLIPRMLRRALPRTDVEPPAPLQVDTAPRGIPLPLAGLTHRQCEVLALVVDGLPSKAIALQLGISQRTVENHRASIMTRTGATSLPALVRWAMNADRTALPVHPSSQARGQALRLPERS